MEIYDEVLQMCNSNVINHPLLAYDEPIDDYIRERSTNYISSDGIETDEIYSLFLALATRHIKIEENEGEPLKYLFQSIGQQLRKISDVIEPDVDQFISSLGYVDLNIIPFLLDMILLTGNPIMIDEFITAILELDFDDDRNYDILDVFRKFYAENEFDENLFISLITNDNWRIVVDLIESSLNEYENFQKLIEEYGDEEVYDYFN